MAPPGAVAQAAPTSEALTSPDNNLSSHEPRLVAQDNSPATLFTLPRELRDLIWTYALVRPKIHVAWVACKHTAHKSHSRTCHHFQYFDDYNNSKTAHGSGTYVGLTKQPKDWLDLTVSAFLEEPQAVTDVDNDQPYLNTLLVCRQVYHEAALVFYSQNCFVFGSSALLVESGSTALLPAYAFLKDRSETTLKWIKRIELQFISGLQDPLAFRQPAFYPVSDTSFKGSEQPQIAQLLFPFIKVNLSLDYLGLSFAGWCTAHKLPDDKVFESPEGSTLAHLCNLGKVGRLAIKYATESYLLKTSSRSPENRKRCVVPANHGRECFGGNATRDDSKMPPGRPLVVTGEDMSGCGIAHESLRAAAFARLLRHHILENGEQRGFRHIKIAMGVADRDVADEDVADGGLAHEDVEYIYLQTDDDKTGKSYLEKEQLQDTSINKGLSEFDPFASAGGSGVLDEVQPHGWTPQWAVGKQ